MQNTFYNHACTNFMSSFRIKRAQIHRDELFSATLFHLDLSFSLCFSHLVGIHSHFDVCANVCSGAYSLYLYKEIQYIYFCWSASFCIDVLFNICLLPSHLADMADVAVCCYRAVISFYCCSFRYIFHTHFISFCIYIQSCVTWPLRRHKYNTH